MLDILFVFIQFLIAASIIVVSGSKLSIVADRIAYLTGIGKVWIGMIALGIVTSSPECITAFCALYVSTLDLALGNFLGENLFHLLILALIDFTLRNKSIFSKVGPGVRLSFWLNLLLLLLVFGGILLKGFTWQFCGLGVFSWLISIVYLSGMYYMYQKSRKKTYPQECSEHIICTEKIPESTLLLSILKFLGWSIIIVGCSLWLALSADFIATFPFLLKGHKFILGRTLVGTILVAITTSLPELSVTMGCLKQGSYDMAVGNITGSNCIDIFFISLLDFFQKGSLFFLAGFEHLITSMAGIIVIFIAILGLESPPRRKFWRLSWLSWSLLLVYLISIIILFSNQTLK